MPKPHLSIIGLTEYHDCGRCSRNLSWMQFPAVKSETGNARSHKLHPYCYTCLEQRDGRWTKHPLYTPSLDRFWKTTLQSVKAGARPRGIAVDISKDYLLGLYLKQEGRCAISGMSLLPEKGYGCVNKCKASVDRIDSSGHYVRGNIQIVAYAVNIMKNDMSDAELLRWCGRIVAKQQEKEDNLLEAIS